MRARNYSLRNTLHADTTFWMCSRQCGSNPEASPRSRYGLVGSSVWMVSVDWEKDGLSAASLCARSAKLAREELVRALRHYQTWTAFTRGGPDLP
jgi:hypothetical protein